MRYREIAKHSPEDVMNYVKMQRVAVSNCMRYSHCCDEEAFHLVVEKKRRNSTHGHVSLRGDQLRILQFIYKIFITNFSDIKKATK